MSQSTIIIPESTYKLPLRQSSVGTCLHCKRCFMFRSRWLLYPKNPGPRVAANLGRMVHWLLAEGPDSPPELVKNTHELQIIPLEKLITEDQDPFGEAASAIRIIHASVDKAIAVASMIWDNFPPSEDEEVIACEQHVRSGFSVPTSQGSVEMELEGTLDKITRSKSSGRAWCRDFKSTSRDPNTILTGYSYSLQCRMYRLLAESFLYAAADKENPEALSPDANPRVYGFVLDILQMPGIKMSGADRAYTEHEHTFTRGARKGETEMRRDHHGEPILENYITRCLQWYTDKGTKPVESHAIAYTEPIFNSELRQALLIANTHNVCDPDPELFSRDTTTTHCTAWNRVCDYYPLCNSDYPAWPALMDQFYTQKTPEEVLADIRGPQPEPQTEGAE